MHSSLGSFNKTSETVKFKIRDCAEYNIKTLGKWFNDVYNKRKKTVHLQ